MTSYKEALNTFSAVTAFAMGSKNEQLITQAIEAFRHHMQQTTVPTILIDLHLG